MRSYIIAQGTISSLFGNMMEDNIRKRMYIYCVCDWVILLYKGNFFFFFFLGLNPQRLEIPRLGVESEL